MTPATDAAREAIARLEAAANRELGFRRGILGPDRVIVTRADLQQLLALTEAASQPREGEVVIQHDRDFAALLSPTYAASILAGDMDDTENVQVFARYRQSLTQRPPEQAGAVPAGMGDALSYIATHGELIGASRCVEVAQEALAVTASRCDTMLGNGPAYGQCTRPSGHPGNCSRHSFPPPPDAGPGEIPAGMVAYGPDQEKIWLALEQAAIDLGGAGAHLISSRQSNLWLDIAIRAYANLADTIRN